MTSPFTLSAFISELEDLPLEPAQLEALFVALVIAERPRSIRVLFWLLCQTLQHRAELQAAIMEDWMPGEADLAQLLDDAGEEGARAVLAMVDIKGQLKRLWQISDDAGLHNLTNTTDPWRMASLAPMAALYAEQQLDVLVAAVARGRQWSDPADILNQDGETDIDIEALIGLAQARMVRENGGSEALNIVTLRLLSQVDRVN